MGRLVQPMSKEEFAKLPKWQQWISNNGIIFFAVIVIASLGGVYLIFG